MASIGCLYLQTFLSFFVKTWDQIVCFLECFSPELLYGKQEKKNKLGLSCAKLRLSLASYLVWLG